ncbi:hypothetical protein OUZ56_028459 [Daphnia magna]|uniref:Uncharacterized protein n=1 Tax=Daphnia magna TaxID=35525 RepID=A0ABR0B410_9CRUS|nr:hypothetical protein OUZ56_028459 [Daphnia magna]
MVDRDRDAIFSLYWTSFDPAAELSYRLLSVFEIRDRPVAAITVESTPEGSPTPPPLIRNSFHQCPVRVPLNPRPPPYPLLTQFLLKLWYPPTPNFIIYVARCVECAKVARCYRVLSYQPLA